MPHKSFKQRSSAGLEKVTFELCGERTDGEPWCETFAAVPVAPAGVLADFLGSYTLNGDGERIYQPDVLLRYVQQTLVPDDVERFEQLVRDPDRLLTLDVLGDVVGWLAPIHSGFPT